MEFEDLRTFLIDSLLHNQKLMDLTSIHLADLAEGNGKKALQFSHFR